MSFDNVNAGHKRSSLFYSLGEQFLMNVEWKLKKSKFMFHYFFTFGRCGGDGKNE